MKFVPITSFAARWLLWLVLRYLRLLLSPHSPMQLQLLSLLHRNRRARVVPTTCLSKSDLSL